MTPGTGTTAKLVMSAVAAGHVGEASTHEAATVTATPTRQRGLFVAIEGPTGVGKTTLAAFLAHRLNAAVFFDPFEANPFLRELYAPGHVASPELTLRVELTFLALRLAQLRHLSQILAIGGVVITDWHLMKQPIFAATTCPTADAERISATCDLWADSLPAPDVLVAMNATASTLCERVRRRGRAMETAIDEQQLSALSGAFGSAFDRYSGPILRLHADAFDVFNPSHVDQLAETVRHVAAERTHR
jgi:deoxyguanosine kinase